MRAKDSQRGPENGVGGWLRSRQDAGCRTGLSVTCEQNIVNKMQLDSGTGR